MAAQIATLGVALLSGGLLWLCERKWPSKRGGRA